ncbi:toxin glutamine deamidase domain-containing protein [Kitasatospora sp. NPDC056138]|uniref:toxin glutamine deamidase domain-containing protein n=1 Tax=Kitasatospora sp. NPDC056138 TaxID=3345724 RepID=UPI0035DE9229
MHASGGAGGFATGPVRPHEGGSSQPAHRQDGPSGAPQHDGKPEGPAHTDTASVGTMERPTDTTPHPAADTPSTPPPRQDTNSAAPPPVGGMPHPAGGVPTGGAAPTGAAPSRVPHPADGGAGPGRGTQSVSTGPVRPSRTPSEGGGSGIPARPARETGPVGSGSARTPRPSADTPSATPHRPDTRTPDSRTPQPRTAEPRTPDHRAPEQSTPHHQDDRPKAAGHAPDSKTPDHKTPDSKTPDHTPQEHAPKEHAPDDHRSQEHAPKDHAPKEHAPDDHRSQEHAPKDHADPEHQAPGHDAPTHDAPGHDAPGHDAPAHDRPLSDSRPHDTPGGLAPVEPHHQHELESRIPRNPDGTPQRHPDPHGDWPGAVNGDGHRQPGRNNNCLDVALSTADTYSGHPTAAAPRSHDGSDAGEHGGRDRAEHQLGAPFRDLGNGKQAYHHLEDQLHKSGHGSQAVIITQDAHGRAHAWNAVNHNGKITYLDNQTGARSDHPIHDGKHGVWAIPLDPNRHPLPDSGHPATGHPDSSHPSNHPSDHPSDHSSNKPSDHPTGRTAHPDEQQHRRPADPAGLKRPNEGGDDQQHKKVHTESSDDPKHKTEHDGSADHTPDDKGKGKATDTEHPRHGDEQGTDHLEKGVHPDSEQKRLREQNPVRSVEMDHVYKQLDRWAEENPQHLAKLLQRTEGPDGHTFKKSELEHALPGFRDMHPGEQGAVVAALGRMSHSFHEQHGVGASPEHRQFPYAESDKAGHDGKDSKGNDLPGGAKDEKSRGAADHAETKTDKALTGQKGIRDAIKSGFKTSKVTTAVENAGPHRPDFTEKNYAVVEVRDTKTGEVHYVVESSVPPSADRKGVTPLHSEPHLGNWVAKLNDEHGSSDKRYEMVSLYTEREPCGKGPGHGHCSDYLSSNYKGVPIYYATGYRKGDMPDYPVMERPAAAPKNADDATKAAAKAEMDKYDAQKKAYEKAWLKAKKGMDADLRHHVAQVGGAWAKAQKNGLGHGATTAQPQQSLSLPSKLGQLDLNDNSMDVD